MLGIGGEGHGSVLRRLALCAAQVDSHVMMMALMGTRIPSEAAEVCAHLARADTRCYRQYDV